MGETVEVSLEAGDWAEAVGIFILHWTLKLKAGE
jgi:hypothetical protein